uniref:Venom dipeptidyl peptidase 4 n=1 Tax=Cacopsylla melanoneura TaxID=428564 RepID=A0A8D9FBW5_9HEMI
MNTVSTSHHHGGSVSKKGDALEELVSIAPNERNWRGICIALLVIVGVLSLIVFFIVLLSPPYSGQRSAGQKFTIEHITGNHFYAPPYNGTWVSDHELVYRSGDGGLSLYNVDNNTVQSLMTNSTFRQLNAVEFYISSDIKYVILATDVKRIYTNLREARYYIFEIASQSRLPIRPTKQQNINDHEAPYLQYISWGPVGNALVFVYNRDIYYSPTAKLQDIYRLTNTGSDVVSNGIPDWLYQEEIFKLESCVWFSKDGKHLVYATFNDTKVGVMRYPVYSGKYQYPQIESIAYPKPNTPNPEVTIWLVNLESLNHNGVSPRHISIPKSILAEGEPYLIGVSFARKKFAVIWLNRKHSEFVISICDTKTGECMDSYTEKVTTKGWVNPHSNILFSNDEHSYLTLLPIIDGVAGQFYHICQINITTSTLTPYTHGRYTVTRLLSWDEASHHIYFEALPEGMPSQRHVYKLHGNLNISLGIPECMTCPGLSHNVNYTGCMNLSKIENEVMNTTNVTLYQWDSWPVKTNCCLFVRAHFSLPTPLPKYYVVECLGPDVPMVILMDTVTNQRINFLNNYTKLAVRYQRMAAPHVKIFEVDSEFGYQSQVKLLIPSNFRDYDDLVFPLLFYVAGKPGTQSVTHEWGVNWATYLVSNKNFIVAIVDSRGSSGQGLDLESQIQYKLGQYDVEDQLAILNYIKDLEFIDKTKIGIWGQGYGGFLTAMMMSRDSESLLKCGISLSPITNWAHYNSVWTEKFMGTPNVSDNFLGYEESDLSKHVAGLKGKEILFIHGSADISVPYQHSMILTRALTNANIIYKHQTYTDEGYTFQGVKTHLYQTIETFWEDCFGPTDIEEWEEGLSFLTFTQ